MGFACLSPAYVWDCEDCGRENFQRSISTVLRPDNEDDAETIRDMMGLSDGDPIPSGHGVMMTTRPNRVTCKHCGKEFEAIDTGAERVGDEP